MPRKFVSNRFAENNHSLYTTIHNNLHLSLYLMDSRKSSEERSISLLGRLMLEPEKRRGERAAKFRWRPRERNVPSSLSDSP